MKAEAQRRATINNLLAAALLIVGLFVMIYGIMNLDTASAAVVVGVLMMLGGLIFAAIKGRTIYVSRIRDGEAWLSGAGPEFLAALPAYK